MDTLADNATLHTPQSWRPPNATLSNEDRRELEASAITPEVRDGRGYWTATSRSQLVGMFPKWQRRATALVVPMFSPDGVSTRAQIKPRTPRKRDGKTVKYETAHGAGLILDVHPSMLEKLRDPREPLLITEGVKTGDSATSRGRCTVVLAGVDCWQSKGVPLPCWEHIPLEGRRVFVCFDADVMTKPEVQRALAKLVAFLEDRGAIVRVIYLRRPGGLDDNLAAGERLAELEMAACRFDRGTLAAERLERTPDLRRTLAWLWEDWREMPVKGTGENTRRAVVRELTREAEQTGKVMKDGRVRVRLDRRTLSERVGSSQRAVHKAIEQLEGEKRLMRDNAGRKRDRAGAFILIPRPRPGRALGNQYGERGTGEEASQEREVFSHLSKGPSDRGDYPLRAPSREVPALRWPAVIRRREKDLRGRPVVVYDYLDRLGKKREAILLHVLEAGGSVTVGELMARFAGERTRPRDFRRRVLGPLNGWRAVKNPISREKKQIIMGPPVVDLEDIGEAATPAEHRAAVVRLREDWLEALELHRQLTGEIDREEGGRRVKGAATLQREDHERQRAAYRTDHERPADPVPDMTPIPDLRAPWPTHPTGCACPSCEEKLGRVIGEHVEDCRCAVCFTARKAADAKNVVTLPRREAPADPGDDWRGHPLDCECQRCTSPPARYATPFVGSAS